MKRAALIAGLTICVLSAPARAGIQNLTVELPVSTWHEPLIALYSGQSDCFIQVGGVEKTDEGPTTVVTVKLDQYCILDPPILQPFSGQADLGDLPIGLSTVRFKSGDETLFSGQVRVYAEADLEIGLPEHPSSGNPLSFTVTGYTTGCVGPDPPTVEGHVITAFFPVDCPILPPGGGIFTYQYTTPALAAGNYELRVFADGPLKKANFTVYDSSACVPSADALCLTGNRFRLEVAWTDFARHSGKGQAVQLAGRDNTGLFWFFDPGNIELTVKVLNGCGLNSRYWVFLASGSTVEYTLTVTDTKTGATWDEHHPSGLIPALIADTSAFATCP